MRFAKWHHLLDKQARSVDCVLCNVGGFFVEVMQRLA